MNPSERDSVEAELRTFAERRLNAEKYPDCRHHFGLYTCPRCRSTELHATIERHERDKPGDFEGILWTECLACHAEQMALGVTPYGKKAATPAKVEHPTCSCGHTAFHIASCDRWETWGFFDEGTVVAMCTACRKMKVLLDTD